MIKNLKLHLKLHQKYTENNSLVERKLQGGGPWTLEDTEDTPNTHKSTDITIYHVPGHSLGSLALHFIPEACLFTGDSLAFSAGAGNRLSMFPRYGYDLRQQAQSVVKLLELQDFVHLLPGHGRSYVFLSEEEKGEMVENMLEAEGMGDMIRK